MNSFKLYSVFFLFVLGMNCALSQHPADPDYFNFLKKNQSNYKIRESSSLVKLIEDSKKANLVMIGEMHGTKTSYTFITDYITLAASLPGFKYILIEHDAVSAELINQYLITGDTIQLNRFFNAGKGSFMFNQSYYNFFKTIHQLNKTRKNNEIQVIGIDIQQSLGLGIKYIMDSGESHLNEIKSTLPGLYECLQVTARKDLPTDTLVKYLQIFIEEYKSGEEKYNMVFKEKAAGVKHVVKNIQYLFECNNATEYNEARDKCMLANFIYYSDQFNLSKKLSVGFFGRTHAYQSASTKNNWLTAQIKKHYPSFTIQSICLLYDNCKFLIPKAYFPNVSKGEYDQYFIGTFFDDKKDFTGIDKLILASGKNTNIVYHMNKPNSPYHISRDLVFEIQANKSTLDYFDTAVLIQNSDPVVPL